jgi:hypothetical protein
MKPSPDRVVEGGKPELEGFVRFIAFVYFVLSVWFQGTAVAQTPIDEASIPEELRDWVDWIDFQHPDRDCARLGTATQCVWPGRLELDVGVRGGTFTQRVHTDRPATIALPYGEAVWPQIVQVNGVSMPVVDVGGVPSLSVKAGESLIKGNFVWNQLPTSLKTPKQTGSISLRLQGERIANPQLSSDGILRLGSGAQEESDENRLTIDVSRLIEDGVPVIVHTHIEIRASGAAREVNLGQVLVPNTELVQIDSVLPTRLDEEKNLIVRLRPGTYSIRLVASHQGPANQISSPEVAAPWPEVEYWGVKVNDRIRAANFSGPPGIDPARTTMPKSWHQYTTFQVSKDQPLEIEELRRGEPNPAPNQLRLSREFWLDHDGKGWTVRDTFSGSMHQGWRLDIDAEADLGHVTDHNIDQVITVEEQAGVEVRKERVAMVAESRLESSGFRFPAVGWNTDVQELDARVHLPPGYRLLTASGVDNLAGSVLGQWNLFDLFFVLILTLAIAKLTDMKWGAVALIGLTLARHEVGAPAWLWVLVVVALALQKAVKKGILEDVVLMARWLFVGLLLIVVSMFAIGQARQGVFPQLETKNRAVSDLMFATGDRYVQIQTETNEGAYENAPSERMYKEKTSKMDRKEASVPQSSWKGKSKRMSAQIDPDAVVQTGPGIPTWVWATQPLRWSGPVDRGHQIRLFVLGPVANMLLAFLRVGLLLALALRLAQIRRFRLPSSLFPAAVVALAVGMVIPAPAMAAPSEAMLKQLDERLYPTQQPGEQVVTNPAIRLQAEGEELVLVAEVHASNDGAWPIPGPTSAWVPDVVLVDGKVTHQLARLHSGFLHVRLEKGIHTVEVRGTLPKTSSITLQFGVFPKRMSWQATDWELAGQKADGSVDGSVQLIRTVAKTDGEEALTGERLAPWLEVHRTLDLGLPWRVHTEVIRRGASTEPLAVRIPLIPGEGITSSGFEVEQGAVLVTMERAVNQVEWVSTLDEETVAQSDQAGWRIPLTAPKEVVWNERWTLFCSPLYRCATQGGPAPLHHVVDGVWSPEWLVWPGETVNVDVSRPQGSEGQTVTIDDAQLEVSPGRRQQASRLDLQIRTSQGGHQILTLPPDAELQSVLVGGRNLPLQMKDGIVRLPLKPGSQALSISWIEHRGTPIVNQTPKVALGGQAVNAKIRVKMPEGRWIAALFGPSMGPVPLFWLYVLISCIAAPLLGRLPYSRLKTWQWALLCLGMTQVHFICPVIVIGWLLAFGHREKYKHPQWLVFNVWQVGLIGLTFLAAVCLYFSIHAGLLWTPDMQVQGNGSWDSMLIWYVDRVSGDMPQATIVSFPLWVWRVLMLLWSLWLAASLVVWVRWAWRAFSTEGFYALPIRKPKNAPGQRPKTALDELPETALPTETAESGPVKTAE